MKFIALFLASSSAISLSNKEDPLPYGDYFHSDYAGFPGTVGFAPEYERVIPDHFTNKHLDDQFMNSMLTNYSKEGRDENGNPNGKFFVDKEQARKASEEILKTHLHLKGEDLKTYMMLNFEETWNYWDVLHNN